MIDEIHVKDVALIRDATLFPATGLTVVTGETGAGKTALLSALALIAGGRADATVVREGAPAAQVEGRFIFAEGSERGSGETVVARQLTADGRSRVHLDGSISSVGQLAEGVGASIDLCGQHEHQRLMHVANHRSMLDAWAFDEIVEPLTAYAEAFQAAQEAARAVAAVEEAGKLSADAVDAARFTIDRIDAVSPEAEEYEHLRSVLARAENAEALAVQVNGAHDALSGDGGALDAIGTAIAALDDAARSDATLEAAAQSLREASYVVEDIARDVRSYRDGIEYDPAELEHMQERMGQIQGLLRSYGPGIDDVLAARDAAQATVAAVEEFDEQIARAKADQEAAERTLADAASALHVAHTQLAPRFAENVSAQMQRLELAGASLECLVEELPRADWALVGPDRIEFMFKPAAGMGARPLVRIASGGEVSRVMLAIKVVLGETDDVETLVFDEVDAGVGGTAARALADVLADLARTHQVIVVTHLPQVAVLGDTHYVVRKSEGDFPETTLESVSGQARVAEVARMLSGDMGGVSRAHAAQMLEEAHQLHTGK